MKAQVSFYHLRQERKRARLIERNLDKRLANLERDTASIPETCVTVEVQDIPAIESECRTSSQMDASLERVIVLHALPISSETVVQQTLENTDRGAPFSLSPLQNSSARVLVAYTVGSWFRQ